ncbi:MAG: hypothetical protein V3U76_03565 [Granulosicoccus sp.]
MSVLGFIFALALTVISVVVWPFNHTFVIVCTTAWALFSCVFALGLQRRERCRLAQSNLEIPDIWHRELEQDKQLIAAKPVKVHAEQSGRVQIIIDATTAKNFEESAYSAAGGHWQNELRKSRRLNLPTLERNYITSLWFYKNRSVYDNPTYTVEIVLLESNAP